MMARSMPSLSAHHATLTPDQRANCRRRALRALKPKPGRSMRMTTVTCGKTFAEREIHILEIGAGAMEKNDRRHFMAAVSEFDHMLTKAVDFNEAAGRHMRPLDQMSSR